MRVSVERRPNEKCIRRKSNLLQTEWVLMDHLEKPGLLTEVTGEYFMPDQFFKRIHKIRAFTHDNFNFISFQRTNHRQGPLRYFRMSAR